MKSSDLYMYLIVDIMDHNTTTVMKKQILKNIVSQFMKTYLYNLLVHGVGLYGDVYIDTYHKHNINQVIVTLMHMITNMKQKRVNYY